MIDLRKACRRAFPKVSYCNFRKEFPNASADCWKQWFSFKRYWSGRIWYFLFWHHQISFDFRLSFSDDMAFPNTTKKDREAVNGALAILKEGADVGEQDKPKSKKL